MAEKIIDIKLNSKEAQKELEALDKDIQQLEDNVQDFNQELFKLETQLAKTPKSSKQYKELNDKIKLTKNTIKKETLELKSNNKQKQRLNKQTTQLNKKLKQQAKNHNDVSKGLTKTIGGTGVLDRATGGLFSTFQGLSGGLAGATRGMKLFTAALIGTGVGLLVVSLGTLITYFKSSEEGQNKLTKAFNIANAAIANVVETVSLLGEGLINIGSSISEYFFGDGSVEDVLNTIGKTADTVSEKISTIGEDIKEDVKVAGQLSDSIAKADKIDRALLVQRQKDNIRINDLRTKAYDTERFNNQERIKFLEDAVKIEDNITNKEIKAARLRFEAKKAENDMTTLVTKEAADEQAKLEAKLFELEAKKINRQREVANQRQMILRKDLAEQEKIKKDADDKEIERVESIQEILDDIQQQKEDEEAETELEQNNLEEQRILKELETLEATEAEKQNIREFYSGKRQELEANRIKEEEKLEKIAQKAKLQMAKQTLINIANAFGKNTEAGKAAAVAASLINTYQGITAELATKTATPFEFGLKVANIAATTAIGFKSVKDILATNPRSTASAPSASRGGGRQSTTAASITPTFNVVGAAPENQLAQSIGQLQDKPVKAFVVSSEMTNQQSLDRNIEDNASLG